MTDTKIQKTLRAPHRFSMGPWKWMALFAGALLLTVAGIVAWIWSAPRTYQVRELSASGWVLPALGVQVHGTLQNWTLSTANGPRVVVRSGTVESAIGFVSRECGLSTGDVQKWQWVSHSHHREAIVRFGNCRMVLQEVHHEKGGNP